MLELTGVFIFPHPISCIKTYSINNQIGKFVDIAFPGKFIGQDHFGQFPANGKHPECQPAFQQKPADNKPLKQMSQRIKIKHVNVLLNYGIRTFSQIDFFLLKVRKIRIYKYKQYNFYFLKDLCSKIISRSTL